MTLKNNLNAFVLGTFIFLAFTSLGYFIGNSAIKFKEYERTVTVKGLSEKEVQADIVLWPIQFTAAGNNLEDIYALIDRNTKKITEFLIAEGVDNAAISRTTPSITDRFAQQYGNQATPEFRYTATQTITVYSHDIESVRRIMGELSILGKQGIVFSRGDYQSTTEYLFTRLNEIKPEMIEEATRKAREVAEKFALDSKSTLGKIRKATQGRFSIAARDKNNPHIKKIRVVSTVEYYLSG